MAMMTGRVLLVCALCVLWCGATDGAVGVVSGGEDNSLKELFVPVARLKARQEQSLTETAETATEAAEKAAAKATAASEAAEKAK
ncbi:Mucin-associated surface protein (MASP), putative, partial [Trypanosoma cruzi]